MCNLPSKSLFFVSRQFKQELEDTINKFVSALVTDLDERSIDTVTPSGRILQCSSMKLELVIGCSSSAHDGSECRAGEELQMHHMALTKILYKFRCFQDISINLYMRPHLHKEECEHEVMKHCPKFVSGLGIGRLLTTLNVYQQHFQVSVNTGWDFRGEPRLTMTWSSASGQL